MRSLPHRFRSPGLRASRGHEDRSAAPSLPRARDRSSQAFRAALAADEGGHGIALRFGQIRVPNVEDEDDAERVAVVHRLMLDRIVEDERISRHTLALFRPDPEPTSFGDDQWQMADQPRVA